MKMLVGVLQPFAFKQKMYVYEDGNKIEEYSFSVKEMPSQVVSLVRKYDIHQIKLAGGKRYAKGIANQIIEEGLSNFENFKVEIECI